MSTYIAKVIIYQATQWESMQCSCVFSSIVSAPRVLEWLQIGLLCKSRSQAKACMLKLASHRRWFDSIVIYVLQTFQFYFNDSIETSVWSAVKDGISLTTVNLDYIILDSLKKQVFLRHIIIILLKIFLVSHVTTFKVVWCFFMHYKVFSEISIFLHFRDILYFRSCSLLF